MKYCRTEKEIPPLGFYVLSLLIVEATIGLVLTASKLSAEHVWWGFLIAVGLFLLVFIVVTVLVICFPKNLLFGKVIKILTSGK